MNIKMLPARSLLLPIAAIALYASPLFAHCLDLYHADDSSGWIVNASAEYNSVELESTDQYLSGPAGSDNWKAVHDVDGDLYGFSISAKPPILGKRATFDFSYLSGDLSGTFNTREISPTTGAPYHGTVKYDRDEWELGANIYILNAVYARLKYATFEMDGAWVYSDGSPNEPQRYEFDAYTIGAGFRQHYNLAKPDTDFLSRLGLLVDVFFGLSIFDYEHTEQLTGASVKTDGIGYEMGAELLGTYKLNPAGNSRIFAGLGYIYKNNDDSSLDLAEKRFTAKLGILIDF